MADKPQKPRGAPRKQDSWDDNDSEQPKPRTARKWGIRILIGTVLGVAAGAAIGVMGVRTLEPGRPGQPDSLQILLDSVARSQASTDTVQAPAAPAPPVQDTATQTAVAVPDVRDLEEGGAREMLEELGFDIGTVLFRTSNKPAGTVLSTFPVAGERVTLPATINLIVSDGRG